MRLKPCKTRTRGDAKQKQKSSASAANRFADSFASSFASGGSKEDRQSSASSFASGGGGRAPRDETPERDLSDQAQNTARTAMPESDREGGGPESEERRRRLALKWHPFHPDVQKTVHFWGYSGSLTDPPCTRDSVNWKVMDVPAPVSRRRLDALRRILLANVDADCRRTSVHDPAGSVARPTQEPLRYYKCTRDDYVSDEERAVCSDEGCARPFGSELNRYYSPIVRVTGPPPTRSPSKK